MIVALWFLMCLCILLVGGVILYLAIRNQLAQKRSAVTQKSAKS